MKKFEIIFYTKKDSSMPAQEFISSLDPKMKAKILRIIDLLEVNGPLTRLPYSEHLEDGIFEIRAIQGSNITRVLYFFTKGQKIVLTHGFKKKTQKTPRKEIELAKKFRSEYEGRA